MVEQEANAYDWGIMYTAMGMPKDNEAFESATHVNEQGSPSQRRAGPPGLA